MRGLMHDRDYRRSGPGISDDGNGPAYYRGSSSRFPHDNSQTRDGRGGGRDDWTSVNDIGGRGNRRGGRGGLDKPAASFSSGYGMDARYSGDERGRTLPGNLSYNWNMVTLFLINILYLRFNWLSRYFWIIHESKWSFGPMEQILK